jgi:hypothetical protein
VAMAQCARMSLWTLVLGDRLAGLVWEGRGWFEPWLSDLLLVTVCIYFQIPWSEWYSITGRRSWILMKLSQCTESNVDVRSSDTRSMFCYCNHSQVNRYGARYCQRGLVMLSAISVGRVGVATTSLGGRLLGVGLELHPSYLPYRETCDDASIKMESGYQ